MQKQSSSQLCIAICPTAFKKLFKVCKMVVASDKSFFRLNQPVLLIPLTFDVFVDPFDWPRFNSSMAWAVWLKHLSTCFLVWLICISKSEWRFCVTYSLYVYFRKSKKLWLKPDASYNFDHEWTRKNFIPTTAMIIYIIGKYACLLGLLNIAS